MTITRRDLIKFGGVAAAAGFLPGAARAQKLEKPKVHIAVGGKPLIYYLPLTIAEHLGYFKDEGLDITISDFAGGSKSLQAVVGGSADVVCGAFEHTLNMQSKGQFFRAFVMLGRAPMIGFGVSPKTMANYKSAADLKGKKIGVTAPGSSTNMLVSFFLAKNGMKDSDVSFIGVGAGSGAVNALRSGQIDAMSNTDPVISLLQSSNDLRMVADTRTLKDTQDIFGGMMPAGGLYAPQAFIDANPNTVQALANAMVRADKWIQENDLDKISKAVPEGYLLGDPAVYKLAVKNSLEGLSPDGLVPPDGAVTALKALRAYIPDFPAQGIDPARAWTNEFAERANKKYPHA
jgi:NitT/TauT family transport system substrate-binding protein